MLKQKEQSAQFTQFQVDQTQQLHISGETVFTGYEKMIDEGKIVALLHDYKPVQTLRAGEKGIVVLDKTPFYAESGGQVGDTGYMYFANGSFRVHNTQKKGSVYLHSGTVIDDDLNLNTIVRAEVDKSRAAIKLNHSATHLLHEALRRVLGEHVTQKGSLVEAKKLRFDFSHLQPLTQDQIYSIERLVNQQIRGNYPLHVEEKSLNEAKASGAMALFSEKYADQVRVVKMGDFSTEICGGTHVNRTGDIGLFKIISEFAVAAGIRRIEAVTGTEALHWIEHNEKQLHQLSEALKVNQDQLPEKINQVIDQNRLIQKEMNELKEQLADLQSNTLLHQVKKIKTYDVLIAEIPSADRDTLRKITDELKQKLNNHIILLSTIVDDKVIMISAVNKTCFQYFNAPDLLKTVAAQIGGTGGGRPDLAQGGGDRPAGLAPALKNALEWIEQKLK